MMAGNPNWWNMNIPLQPQPSSSSSSSSSPFLSQSPVPPLFQYPQSSLVFGSSPTSLPLASLVDYGNPELPQSWSQLLLNGFSGEEENASFLTRNLVGNWEEETIFKDKSNSNSNSNHLPLISTHDLKQEAVPKNNNLHCQYGSDQASEELFRDEHQAYHCINKQLQNTNTSTNTWSTTAHNMVPSPTSCVTTLCSSTTTTNVLDFSNSTIDNKVDPAGSRKNHQKPDHSSNECNSTGRGRGTGGTCKKARVQTSSSSTQSPLKVRKEKLGDRITALHQMVSPFGKTDTASVLLEAIGYIRFLQGQIEALSSPYIDNASGNLNNPAAASESGEAPKDLRSRGLCLVPVSCTLQVGNDSSADYWTPAPFSCGF